MTPAQWDETIQRIAEALAIEYGDEDARMTARLHKLKRTRRRGPKGDDRA